MFLVVALLLLGWLLSTPEGVLGKADAVGYAVCHRIEVRSFHLGERQVPLCARCTGQYLGAMLGLVYQAITGRRRTGVPPRRVILFLMGFVVVYGIDGINSYLHLPPILQAFPNLPRLYEPNNTLRLLTGTGMGLVIAAALFPVYNSTVWKDSDPRSALPGLPSLAGVALLAVLVNGLVLSEHQLALYPLALISASGVLVLLTMVYTLVWLMVLRREGGYTSPLQMVLPLTGGFALAIAQIALLDLLRYWATGTWDGFHLG